MNSLGLRSGVIIAAICLTIATTKTWKAAGQGANNLLTVVSAASFEASVAPEAIVAIFGTALVVGVDDTPINPLPTTRLKRQVKVKDSLGMERDAPLFFVSPTQINCVIPEKTATGAATVTVINTETNQIVSMGMVRIVQAAPAIFTANSDGKGVPAATVLRVKKNGAQVYEPIVHYDAEARRFAPIPIKPPAEQDDSVFLILFASGVRGATQDTVKVRIGGQSLAPAFAGPAPGFTGLDQINVKIPGELFRRGRVNLLIDAGGSTSNTTEVETGCQPGNTPPQVLDPSSVPVLVGDQLAITGSGFDPEPEKNLVRIQGIEAKVLSAATGRLMVRVPFGVESGPVSVCSPLGEGRSGKPVSVRTSISGFVEDTSRQALAGIPVRLLPTSLDKKTSTDPQGSFILTDVRTSPAQIIEFDGLSVPGSLPYPNLKLALPVVANRDNQFLAPIALQQITGPSIRFGSGPVAQHRQNNSRGAAPAQQSDGGAIQAGNVVFEVARGTRAVFPPENAATGTLTLTIVEENRTPIPLPAGLLTSKVAQIAPFNVRLNPGAKLTFPNTDNIPPGTSLRLFRIDQRPESPQTLGAFIEVGIAIVSNDGQRIETASNAITDTSIYFVAATRRTSTVVGRITESDGVTPVRLALARSRGQEAFSDGNGGFALRHVIANEGDFLSVDASFQRSGKTVDRAQSITQRAVVGGVTDVGTLKLSEEGSNRPPTILAPTTLGMNIGETRELIIVVADPNGDRIERVAVSGVSFATITQTGPNLYFLKLTPMAGDAGNHTLTITASDNRGVSREHVMVIKVNRFPTANLQAVAVDEDTPRAITLTGNDPDGDSLVYFITQDPTSGRLSGTAPNMTYMPNPNYFGPDSFKFRINDGVGNSNEALVNILVNSVNDAPVLTVPGPQTIDTGGTLEFLVTAFDVDNNNLDFTTMGLPGGATYARVNATDYRFSWRPDSTQFGGHRVIFTVSDNGSPPKSASREVLITVTPRWSQTQGLEGGQIFAFLNLGSNLLAGGAGGAYLSTNQGQSWTLANIGLTNSQVLSLVSTGVNVFAGTDGAGVYVSTNQGQSWVPANTGLTNGVVRSLTVVGGMLLAGTFDGIFRSANQGQNWTPANNGIPPDTMVYALTVSGANLFAGTDRGVFRSSDQGQSWTAASNGLASPIVRALAVSGVNLLAGTFTEGVFLSSNGGQSWTSINNGLTTKTILSLAVSPTQIFAGTSGAGVFASANQGQNWTPVSSGLSNLFINAITLNGANLFAGSNGGVFRSVNQGQNWAAANSGLRAVTALSLATLGSNLFVGTHGDGPYLTINQGQSWVARNTGLLNLVVPALVEVNARMYAGTGEGVFFTDDIGAIWSPANNFLPQAKYINALAVSGSTLFAGISPAGGIYRSDNRGQSWTEVNNGITDRDIRSLATFDSAVFAGTEKGGIFRSTDRGQNWAPVNSGLVPCVNLQGNLRVHALYTSGATLFAGTCNGVYRWNDPDRNWQHISGGLDPNAFVNTLFEKNGALCAGIFGGVFLSANYLDGDPKKVTWNAANTGLAHINVYSLASVGTNLMVGTIGGGVYISR